MKKKEKSSELNQEQEREEFVCPYCGRDCSFKGFCEELKKEDQWAEEGGKNGPGENKKN